MISSNTTRLCIIASITTLLSAAAVVFMWFHLQDLGIVLKDNMQIIKNHAQLEQDYFKQQDLLDATTQQRLQLRQYIFNTEDDAVSFLSTADQISQDLGITLETRTLKVIETDEQGFSNIEIVFHLEGGREASMEMLQLFEALPHHGQIVRLDVLRSVDKETGQNITESTVTLTLSLAQELI